MSIRWLYVYAHRTIVDRLVTINLSMYIISRINMKCNAYICETQTPQENCYGDNNEIGLSFVFLSISYIVNSGLFV